LVPTTGVITEALKAARKVNDYATAVRILEGLKEKVENVGQYKAYLDELKPVIKELGEFCSGLVLALWSWLRGSWLWY
jgi:cytochrome c oxidase subunit 5a